MRMTPARLRRARSAKHAQRKQVVAAQARNQAPRNLGPRNLHDAFTEVDDEKETRVWIREGEGEGIRRGGV